METGTRFSQNIKGRNNLNDPFVDFVFFSFDLLNGFIGYVTNHSITCPSGSQLILFTSSLKLSFEFVSGNIELF